MRYIGPWRSVGRCCARLTSRIEALIDRITYLGFEVRVELELPNERRLWAQTTRQAAGPLEHGKTVHVRPRATRMFDGDGAETVPAGDSPW